MSVGHSEDQSVADSQQARQLRGAAQSSASDHPLARRVAQFASSKDRDGLEALAADIAAAGSDDLYMIMEGLSPFFHEDPEKALLFLKELTSLIAETSPTNALDLSYGFLGFPGVQDIERGLVYEWAQRPRKFFSVKVADDFC